jgi:IclR family transcriptional regulator, acetate operon repressor
VGAAGLFGDRRNPQTEETVNIAVLEDGDVVNIHQVNLSTNRVTVDWLGSHTPLHATSSGKVLLAGARPEARAARLAQPLAAYTSATITRVESLLEELDAVAARGYAVAIEELEEGLTAVAAPIHGPDGEVVASVSVSGPSYRLEPERLDEVGALVVRAASDISRRLGHVTDVPDPDPQA